MERRIFAPWSAPAGVVKGGAQPREVFEDEPDDKSALLRSLFEVRFARLQVMCHGWGKQLPPEDWRMRLLHKALFSTWADIRTLAEVDRTRR